MKTKLLTLLFGLTISCEIFSATKIGELYYNLNATNQTAEVTYQEYNSSSKNYQNLTTVNIPSLITYDSVTYKVTSIGGHAFWHASLTSITIPNSVTNIGNYAFYYCQSMISCIVPDKIKSIGQYTFAGCSKLQSITFSDSLTYIGNWSFDKCTSLQKITIGNGLETIDSYAFDGCGSSVTQFIVTAAIVPTVYSSSFGNMRNSCVLYVIDESVDDYKFASYWKGFKSILPISRIMAHVRFIDWDGTILKDNYIPIGSSATPPDCPLREGYTFIGWDKEYNNITEDITIIALYSINNYNISWFDSDSTLIDQSSWPYGTIPSHENPTKDSTAVYAYSFAGWTPEIVPVTGDAT